MVTKEIARDLMQTLVARCRPLRIADEGERQRVRRELGTALMNLARDEAHGRELVDMATRNRSELPTLSELEEIAAAAAVVEADRRPLCGCCGGAGWVHAVVDKAGRSFARRCNCAGGRVA